MMPKSTLFYRVLANFALLLVILTTMTMLSLSFLKEIKENFTKTGSDIGLLSDLEKVDQVLINAPEAADEFAVTGNKTVRNSYHTEIKDFNAAIKNIRDNKPDTLVSDEMREIEGLFQKWVSEIGDAKIEHGDNIAAGKRPHSSLDSIATLERTTKDLVHVRLLAHMLSSQIIAQQQRSVLNTITIVKDISVFIGLVNILIAVFAIALGFFLTRSITVPVRILKEGTQKIMEGKFESITLHRTDELGQLANDFNNMSAMLGNNYTRLNAYSELVTALNSHEEMEEILRVSLTLLCHHAQASVGALYLVNSENNMLEYSAGYAVKASGGIVKKFAFGEGIPGQCAAEEKNIEVHRVDAMPGFTIDTGLIEIAPHTILAVPIFFQDKIMGVLVLGATHPFDDLQKEIIKNSTPQLGVAITNARNFEASQQLSREIAKKNEEMNAKNVELERAYEVKSTFLAGMSHELRTPLNSIIGFSSVLLGAHSDPLTPDQQMALNKVLKNGKHLLQLINDILDFSKIEAGRMNVNMESEEVSNLVANSLVTVETLMKQKNLVVNQHIQPHLPLLHTDVLKVKQILVNLLSNAVKFTESGEIAITVEQAGAEIAIHVKDSGIGIEKKNYERVFEDFSQVDNSNTRKYKGTGLGLPISRRLARLLGGNLTVESELGKGSTFTLTIPPTFSEPANGKTKNENQPAIEATAQQKATSVVQKNEHASTEQNVELLLPVSDGITILCIDDDPDVIDILKKYIVPEGYSVVGAHTGERGIEIAKKIHPSLITLDIMMPEMDGWQVLRELKKNKETKNIPVVIHSMIDNTPLAVSLGAIDVILKPTDSKKLLALIEKVSKKKEGFVLIVDDNRLFTDTTREFFETAGIKSQVAENGIRALEILNKEHPALILMDLEMPEMDGFTTIQEIQKRGEWRSIPIVIMSGKELSRDEWMLIHSSAIEFIKKTDFSESLTNTINKILHSS